MHFLLYRVFYVFMKTNSKKLVEKAFENRVVSLDRWLKNNGYYHALNSMHYNKKLFTGFRKDGVTPNFDHHICQAQYLLSFHDKLLYPQETLCTVMFHDSMEDKNITFKDIESVIQSKKIAKRVCDSTWRLTKKYEGEIFNPKKVFKNISSCPIASVVKGADRINNFQTVIDVFTKEKQIKYIQEAEDYFFPMLYHAQDVYPSQYDIYQNIISFLDTQIKLIKLTLKLK